MLLLCRNILGEAIGSMTFKELKNMEGRLEKAISRIRSKKVTSLDALNIKVDNDVENTL